MEKLGVLVCPWEGVFQSVRAEELLLRWVIQLQGLMASPARLIIDLQGWA